MTTAIYQLLLGHEHSTSLKCITLHGCSALEASAPSTAWLPLQLSTWWQTTRPDSVTIVKKSTFPTPAMEAHIQIPSDQCLGTPRLGVELLNAPCNLREPDTGSKHCWIYHLLPGQEQNTSLQCIALRGCSVLEASAPSTAWLPLQLGTWWQTTRPDSVPIVKKSTFPTLTMEAHIQIPSDQCLGTPRWGVELLNVPCNLRELDTRSKHCWT